jgi:hypothetical protein
MAAGSQVEGPREAMILPSLTAAAGAGQPGASTGINHGVQLEAAADCIESSLSKASDNWRAESDVKVAGKKM